MMQFIETTGRTQEDAISAALLQLGMERDDVSVEVVDRPKPGFLGFGGNPAKVRVRYDDGKPEESQQAKKQEKVTETPPAPSAKQAEKSPDPKVKHSEKAEKSKETQQSAEKSTAVEKPVEKSTKERGERSKREPLSQEEVAEISQQISSFLLGLFTHLHVEAQPEITLEEGDFQVKLTGENLGALIGRRGETLDSIQQLCSYVVNKNKSKRVRIFLDAENYRAKREETLQKLAEKVAGEAVKHRRNVVLESMNAYERHIIHAALQDVPHISTYSTGSDPNRRTVVCYNQKK